MKLIKQMADKFDDPCWMPFGMKDAVVNKLKVRLFDPKRKNHHIGSFGAKTLGGPIFGAGFVIKNYATSACFWGVN